MRGEFRSNGGSKSGGTSCKLSAAVAVAVDAVDAAATAAVTIVDGKDRREREMGN